MSTETEVPQDRPLGLLPRTGTGRALLAFALLNIFLLFLPVWDVAFNSGEMIVGLLPMTILWAFIACALNNLLAIAVYKKQFKPWAMAVEDADGHGTRS